MTPPIQLGKLPATPEILQFRKSASLTEAMRVLMSDPTFKQAVATLRTVTEPRNLPTPQTGNHPDTTIAHHLFMQMGAWQMLQHLLDMGTHLSGVAAVDDHEFTHNLPQEYQKQ